MEPTQSGSLYNETGDLSEQADLKSYGGFIWAVTSQGAIYRITPRSARLEAWDTLPGNSSLLPFVIEPNGDGEPILFVSNPQGVYRYKLVTKELSDPIYESRPSHKEVVVSPVAMLGGNAYFLIRRNTELIIKCVGTSDWEQSLGALDPADGKYSPILEVDGSIWVLTTQKVVVFPDGSNSACGVERLWAPWHVLPTQAAVWFTERSSQEAGKQSLFRLLFDNGVIAAHRVGEVQLAATLEVDPKTGQIAVFLSDMIRVYSGTGTLERERNVDNGNPKAILLSTRPPFMVWFDAAERIVYRWIMDQPDLKPLWFPKVGVSISRLFMAYGSLLGIEGGRLWLWNFSNN